MPAPPKECALILPRTKPAFAAKESALRLGNRPVPSRVPENRAAAIGLLPHFATVREI
jgi:hypothetical protein